MKVTSGIVKVECGLDRFFQSMTEIEKDGDRITGKSDGKEFIYEHDTFRWDKITSHVRQDGKNYAVIWWYNTATGKLHYSRPSIRGIQALLKEVVAAGGRTRPSYKGYRFK